MSLYSMRVHKALYLARQLQDLQTLSAIRKET